SVLPDLFDVRIDTADDAGKGAAANPPIAVILVYVGFWSEAQQVGAVFRKNFVDRLVYRHQRGVPTLVVTQYSCCCWRSRNVTLMATPPRCANCVVVSRLSALPLVTNRFSAFSAMLSPSPSLNS